MDVDEVLSQLQDMLQRIEDEKTSLVEMQEEIRELIAKVNMWNSTFDGGKVVGE